MIYLDYAATSVHKPQQVIDAVCQALNHLGNAGRGANDDSLSSSRLIFQARYHLNELINGASPSRIAFTANVTESLNIAIKGLLHSGDHVITTMMEHNSVLRPLYQMEKQGVELTILPANSLGRISLDDLESAIKPHTKAVVITHASNLTGNINPLEEICRLAQDYQVLTIIDAAQTLGAIPVDVQALGVDVLCFTGHKSLLGPQGTGGLYVRPGLEIPAYKTGGTGVDTYNHDHPHEMPASLEAGTMNGHGIAGLNAAIKYIMELGIEKITSHEADLAQYFYREVGQLDKVKVYGDFETYPRCPIVTLNIGDLDSSLVADRLSEDYGITIRAGGHCAPLMHQALGTVDQGAVRFSFGHFTSREEVDQAIQAVQQLCKLT